MESTMCSSQKGKPLISIDGFTFGFQKMLAKDTVKRWTCTKKTCKAFVKTQGCDNSIIESILDHNHEKLSAEVSNRKAVSNSIKRAAVEDINEKPMKLICKELKKTNIETFTTNDIYRVRQNLYYARTTNSLIKLPKSISEFHIAIDSTSIITNRNENFIIKNDKDNHIVILSCSSNLSFLSTVSNWYVDGTFEYCPRFFTQLFTIHGLKNGHYIPLVFCLLEDKKSSSYYLVFKYIIEECIKLNCPVSPKVITSDFEISIHNGIRKAFPEADLRGCRFHLGQAWYRKLQALGLAPEYQKKGADSSEITHFLTYIFGLSFLDPEEVGDFFAIDLSEIKPVDERVTQFCDYLVDNYISENSKFPPHLWAEHSSSLERTTNPCESFHSKYNSSFYCPHPNINNFIEIILQFQINTYIKINSVSVPKRIVEESTAKINFVNEKILQLREGTINKLEFVKLVSYKFRKNNL